ncbi:MAG: hypothetical protein RR203_02445 [Synergistaceae bacterium]
MPVTLAQARLNVQEEMEAGVIDEFRKSSWLLDHLPFHNVVSPTGGGATLTYGYTRLLTEASAGFRAINSEYTPQEVTKERKTVELKVMGGSFEIDRVIAELGGFIDEVQLQVSQKVKSVKALFGDTFINGDIGTDANAFDGLEKALAGSSTELAPSTGIDLSTTSAIDENYKFFLDMMDEFESMTCDTPMALIGNTKLLTKIKGVARRAGYFTQSEDAFGRKIDGYNNIPLIDLGSKPASSNPIIGVDSKTGETSLYAVCLGMDHIHAISMAGVSPIQTWLPKFDIAGAVKKGEVEMVAGIAIKQTRSAAVMRKIKVNPVAAV